MVTSKQLLPIYDKPMIYYPLSVLMNAGIRDILIISTPQDTPRFEALRGDGHQFGVQLSYKVQPSPDGLAQAFIIGEEFIGDDSVAMVLGDNIFFGHGLNKRLKAAVENAETGKGATVFGYYVDDPERFGIVEFDSEGKAISRGNQLRKNHRDASAPQDCVPRGDRLPERLDRQRPASDRHRATEEKPVRPVLDGCDERKIYRQIKANSVEENCPGRKIRGSF